MPKRTIAITRLRVGMYLIGIDRSWFHTPFLRNKFLLKEEREIAALRKAGVSEVVIDTDLGLDPEAVAPPEPTLQERIPTPPLSASTELEPPQTNPPGQTVAPISPVRLASQFSEAKQRHQTWTNQVRMLFEKTRATDVVEIAAVQHIVDEVMESLLERQAACLAVLGLRDPDPNLQEHGLTVCTLSLALGKALELSDDHLRHLGMGALLHDIGLAKLPRNIIKRPKAMAPAQQALYQSHTDLGVGLLRKSGSTEPTVTSIIEGHHHLERATATAPDTGIDTHLVKVVSVIDQYDELSTGQTGLPPMSANQVLTQLYQQFRASPDWLLIVSALIRIIGVYPLYSVVSLDNGELGIVAAITPGKAHLPFLYICRDEQNRVCQPPRPLDLTQEPDGGRRVKEIQDPRQCGVNIEHVLKQVAA